jgi:hypothetical protein
MGSYHDYIPDSVVEAYYGWDVDERTPCGTCGHTMEWHEGDNAEKCEYDSNCYDANGVKQYGCECEAWTEGWEPDCEDDDYDRMRDERND